MNARTAKTISTGELFAEEANQQVERMTGKTVEFWNERFKARLVQDVSRGKFNPNAFYPTSKMNAICRHYGFIGDDVVFVRVPTDLILRDNPGFQPPTAFYKGMTQPVATMVAVRLNPNKYSALLGMYDKVRTI